MLIKILKLFNLKNLLLGILILGSFQSIYSGELELNVEKVYPQSRTLSIQLDQNGQIDPQSLPANVEIVDINNDNHLDAFIFKENKLELHFGIIRGFSKTVNGFWQFDQPIKKIVGIYDKKFICHRLDIEFENGQTDYLMQWSNKIISKSEYDAHPEKYQVKRELPKTLQVGNGFQIVWENENLGHELYNVLTGDLDQDGKKELIIANHPILWGKPDVLHIYENVSDNTYQEVFTYVDTVYDFGVMEITDLDADGNLELCVFSGGGPPGWTLDPYLILFENTGDNSFNRQMIPAYVNLSEIHPWCARWADSDLNGKPELVVGMDRDDISTHYTYVEFYENINPNTFDLLQWWLQLQGLPVHGVAVGDLDQDGWGDVYVGMAGASTEIHRWEYDGYQSFQQKWFDTAICNPIFPEIFDFDLDSLDELVFVGDSWHFYRSVILYTESTSDDSFQILACDSTSYSYGSACLWGRNWNFLNNEFYFSVSAEIFPDSGQYFDGYAILLKRNPNDQYPFEPIFYSPVVDSTAIHHALATDLDDDNKVELITGKQFYPARVRIWEEDIVGINMRTTLVISDLLLSAYPNPFNNSTIINFRLSKSGKIDLTIYNILGQKISQPFKQIFYPAGRHKFILNGNDSNLINSGIYFCRIHTSAGNAIIKLLYVK
jgi:hypothetical protein